MAQPTPAKRVAIVGGGVGAAQCAFTLAQLGAEVTIITPFMELGSGSPATATKLGYQDFLHLRPLLLQAARHPRVSLFTNSKVDEISEGQQGFTIQATKYPRYVREDLCTSCGQCTEACSVRIPFPKNGRRLIHSAIHPSHLGRTAVPSTYSIDKLGIAPCTATCPLSINVQGFVSLLARGKIDAALSLINEAAPLAGVLGRICTHPCEDDCKRGEVDEPVSIRALHRYAADHTHDDIHYNFKSRAASRREKIAIVGSGPAGLAAAWELARRGYSPVIFEAHAVVGGMLATGIPRFRLPREVREREVKAIEGMGVEIRNGITIGRDVTVSDLRERGYRAFFLAIGAHKNRGLDIPGEDLEGVVDSISLLFELNMRVGASVGRNMVVIGGGNSAIDSARAARRRSKRRVTILYRRTAEEMTAIREDIEEALNEGISIEYLTSPVEILGDGIRVTGIRCQRMELGEPGSDGRRKPVPVPGSEFVMEADHVVLAIGQRPNTAQLRAKGVELDSKYGTIKIDPLTHQTSIPDVFAGGDCVTGPGSVVEAMAAGLEAAESVDRYLRGRSLKKGRVLERPRAADVDINERYVSPQKRADMPRIPRSVRMGSFEETNMGLSPEAVESETERCLNCALCSGCMECERACELEAVFHSDCSEKSEVGADLIISFVSTDGDPAGVSLSGSNGDQIDPFTSDRSGIYTVRIGGEDNLWRDLLESSSVALKAAAQLDLREYESELDSDVGSKAEVQVDIFSLAAAQATSKEPRIGVILCRCGGSVSSVIDFTEVSRRILTIPGVWRVQEISQACTEEGALQIASIVGEGQLDQLDRVVLAACRCCNERQICFSCTDRRVMCWQYLEQRLPLPLDTALEFVNIREQCAWVHKDDPVNATNKAVELISAGVARERASSVAVPETRLLEKSVLVVGAELCGLAAADSLAAQGYLITVVSWLGEERNDNQQGGERFERRDDILEHLEYQGESIVPWPKGLEVNGSPGSYEVALKYESETRQISAGAIIWNLGQEPGYKDHPAMNAISTQNLLRRIVNHRNRCRSSEYRDSQALREITIGETAGIFVAPSDLSESPDAQIMRGAAIAARVWTYLAQGTISTRAVAVVIDSRLCRGCGDCAAICPYIEMKKTDNDAIFAYVDKALCLGCGACVARCPTGAIAQPLRGDGEIMSMLDGLLSGRGIASVV